MARDKWRTGVLRALVRAGLVAAVVAAMSLESSMQPGPRVLLMVVDGLRPDYVTADVMPRLHALGRRGVVFNAHHAVFPTVTRVNSSSLSTGSYPETHGLMSNTMYSEKTFPTRGLNTSDYKELEAMERAEGVLLTAPTLGQSLERAGKRLLVISAGSSGSAKLLNHPVGNGAVIHPEVVWPTTLAEHVRNAVGPGPEEAVPNTARNKWAVDAYLSLGVGELASDVTAIWFGDPDATAHAKGMGADDTVRALRAVDAEIGRLEDGLRAKGLLERTNLLVTSDHGFSTHTAELKLAALVAPFARPLADGTPDIVVAEGSVNFRGGAPDTSRVAAVVAALQNRPEVGAVFTRPRQEGSMEGVVAGTLSFNVARWNHRRAGEILVSANWTASKNAAGFAGTTTQGGVAGHGTSSPYDIHNTLIVAGPSFRAQATSDIPTANVDLAPTILKLLALPVPSSMSGRAIDEMLVTATGASPRVERRTESARTANGSYQVDAHVSIVNGHRYLDFTEVRRAAPASSSPAR